MMKHITAFLILLLLPLCSLAQTVTLDECQRLAHENYPLIKQYDLIKQTTDYTVDNISKGWYPQISALAQATLQSDVMTLPDPLQKMLGQQGLDVKGLRKDQYRIGVDINQTIYDGGLIREQKNVAQLEGEVQQAQTTTELYSVRGRINELYFGILLLDEKLMLNKDLQTLLQSNLDKLQAMLAHGTAMQSDVNILKAEKLKAEQQATELEASRQSLMNMLSLFTGKQITGIAMPQDIVVSSAGNNRPELDLFNSQIKLFYAREKLLDARLKPRVSAFAQGYYGYPGFDQFDAMFNRTWKLNGMIGVRVSWNIGALYTRKNDRAKLNRRARTDGNGPRDVPVQQPAAGDSAERWHSKIRQTDFGGPGYNNSTPGSAPCRGIKTDTWHHRHQQSAAGDNPREPVAHKSLHPSGASSQREIRPQIHYQ